MQTRASRIGARLAVVVGLVGTLLRPHAARAAPDPPADPPPRGPESPQHWEIGFEGRFIWIPRPPNLTLYTTGRQSTPIEGVPSGFVVGSTPLFAVGPHLQVTYHPWPHVFVPVFGFGIAATSHYRDAASDGLSFSPDVVGMLMSIDLLGLGVETRIGQLRVAASATTGLDIVAFGGQFRDPRISMDANAVGGGLVARGELRVCSAKKPDRDTTICVFGGPYLIEGEHVGNGAVVGFGATY